MKHDGLASARRRTGAWFAASLVVLLALPPLNAQDGPSAGSPTPNRVLELQGDSSWVELPPHIFDELTEATVEGWVKLTGPFQHRRFFDFGAQRAEIYLGVDSDRNLKSLVTGPDGERYRLRVGGLVTRGQWCHVALVTGQGGMEMYFNGELVASDLFTGSFANLKGVHNYLGRESYNDNSPTFRGQIDEVRVWNTARSVEQIRKGIDTTVRGTEPGLVGAWSFDDPQNPGRDSTSNGHHGEFKGEARTVEEERKLKLAPAVQSSNHVLELDGKDSFVELPDELLANLDTFTVEGWIRWRSFQMHSRFFDFVCKDGGIVLKNAVTSPDLDLADYSGGQRRQRQGPGLLRADR